MANATQIKNPHKLLDQLLSERGLRNDSHLAEDIGYSKGRICDFRGGAPVSAEFRLAIQRKYGWSIKKIDMLAPPAETEK